MNKEPAPTKTAEIDHTWQRLNKISQALLQLHKTLLDYERSRYEKTHRKIPSANQFLQLLLGDPQFAWLRKISKLIAAIDTAVDEKKPITMEAASELIKQTDLLLSCAESGDEFSRNYFAALQQSAEVARLHADVEKLCRG